MNISYDRKTVNSPNPLARYAHRNRIRKSIALALSKSASGLILDYGCGSGALVSALLELKSDVAVGYEPFMQERVNDDLPIYKKFSDVIALGSFNLITLFEVVEHLSEPELDEFLCRCELLLSPQGGVLISAPIEIGPALLLKEFNRFIFRAKRPEYGFWEFLKACVLGIPASRAVNIKSSHKGFDFRCVVKCLEAKGWNVQIMSFGPMPIGIWYGNSQVYMWLNKSSVC